MSEPYPQSPADSQQLLTQDHPLQARINELQEQLYRERQYHEITQSNLRTCEEQRKQYADLLSSLGNQLNDAGFVVPF